MSICGVYKIQSLIKPERCYIGSGGNLERRWKQHLKRLNDKNHNPKLQSHFNKYGASDLVFIIIEPCLPQFLIIREQYYLDRLKPFFNIRTIAESNLGIKFTDEIKEKLRLSHLGFKISEETKKKLSISQLGRTKSLTTRLKMSAAQKKQVFTIQRRINTGLSKKGNTYRRGCTLSDETKNKIREARSKQVFSEESKKKRAESLKKYWINKRLKNVS